MLLALVLALAQAGAPVDAPSDPGPYDPLPPLPVEPPGGTLRPDGVVGGRPAAPGTWDDAVGIVFHSSFVGCTGTLIAPDLVLTAGHCAEDVTHVLVGTTDWSRDMGELIEVVRAVPYPDWRETLDVAVLELARWSRHAPRAIAVDCIVDTWLEDGAPVTVAGFGSVENDGNGYNTLLNEGSTVILDHDCSEDEIDGVATGCEDDVPVGMELVAGGNGVDTCYGDSGGPLYLHTPEGAFLAGVTSRGLKGSPAETPCLLGGVYVRPDAVLDWIEEVTARRIDTWNCNEPPEVEAEPIRTRSGERGSTRLTVRDDGERWQLALVEGPVGGEVELSPDGEIVYVADRDFAGVDAFVVAVTDDGHPDYERSGPVTVELTVEAHVEGRRGLLGMGACGGCRQAPAPASGGLLGLAALLAWRRGRRRGAPGTAPRQSRTGAARAASPAATAIWEAPTGRSAKKASR